MCILLSELMGVGESLLRTVCELHAGCHVGLVAGGWRIFSLGGSCPVFIFLSQSQGDLAVRSGGEIFSRDWDFFDESNALEVEISFRGDAFKGNSSVRQSLFICCEERQAAGFSGCCWKKPAASRCFWAAPCSVS